MIRAALCVFVIAVCAVIGEGFALELRLRSRLMKQICSAIDSFEIMIRYRKSTVAELRRFVADSPGLDLLRDALSGTDDTPALLKPPERQALDSLMSSLGTTDEEGQLAMIERARSDFNLFEARAREDEMKKSRLFRALGLLGGVFLAALTF